MSSPRQKTGAMDRTVFSPRPPEFGGPQPAPAPEMEPAGDDWGEAEAPSAPAFDEPAPAEANMDATMFSPPPPELASRSAAQKKPGGRQKGDDDFGGIELPTGKRMDDVPTQPAKGDDVHPLRRGVTSGQHKAPSGTQRKPSAPVPQDDFVSDELPGEEPAAVGAPDIPDEEPVVKGKSNKLPGKSAKAEPATEPKGKLPKKKVPETVPPEDTGGEKPKKKSSRVVLIFTLLLLVVVAVLVLPVLLYPHVEQVRPIRDHPQARQYYDHVEKVINDVRKLVGLDAPAKPAGGQPAANAPAENAPAENTPPANAE
jgi:hypothetical protein